MGNSNSKRSKSLAQSRGYSSSPAARYAPSSSAPPPPYNEAAYEQSQKGVQPSSEWTCVVEVGPEITAAADANDPDDNALQILSKYDIVFIVDDSGSMQGPRWSEAMNALANLVQRVAKYDDDGLDVFFLNSLREGKGLNSAQAIFSFFHSVTPKGLTPLGTRLEQIVLKYLRHTEPIYRKHPDTLNEYVKPVIYIVITDGCPSDDPRTVIETIAKRLDKNDFPTSQVGIQFVQIGDDRGATAFLQSLDDELPASGIRDIVDTTPYRGQSLNDEMLIKIMLGGINKRVDRQGGRVMQ